MASTGSQDTGDGTPRLRGWRGGLTAVVLLALSLRLAGLFRGAHDNLGYYVNPDVPKQVFALEMYLQGQYVRYVGTPAYDGYPFGLNRLDELILRPWLAGERRMVAFMTAGESGYRHPDRQGLVRRMLVLRTIYSMLAMLACVGAAGLVWRSRAGLLVTGLALALSPVCIATAHMASGDVGAELGVALALAALAAHVRWPAVGWLLAAGFATGFGFACKFNAALVGAALVVYTAAVGWPSVRGLLRAGLAQACGFVAGAALFTPALAINPARTLRDIGRNFAYIQAYGAPAGYFDQPPLARVLGALADNAPRIWPALGGLALTLAVTAWVLVLRRSLRRAPVSGAAVPADRRVVAFERALAVFVPVSVFVAMAGKPDAQPFHFALLAGPVALLLARLWVGRPVNFGRGIIRCLRWLVVMAIFELALRALRETAGWAREDNRRLYTVAREYQIKRDAGQEWAMRPIRSLHLETGGASVFRNGQRWMGLPGGDLWRALRALPVPDLPHPFPPGWLITDGPVLPRNERYWLVRQDEPSRRRLVRYGGGGPVTLGLRSGAAPAVVTLRVGGTVTQVRLDAHAQSLTVVEPRRWHGLDGVDRLGRPGQWCEIEIVARIAPVWVVALESPEEQNAFQLWGGQANASARQAAALMRGLDEQTLALLATARYVEGDSTGERLDARDHDRWCLLAGADLVLAAGRYQAALDLEVLSAQARIRLPEWLGPPDAHVERTFEQGLHRVRWTFQKPAFPLLVALPINVVTGDVRLGKWTIEPDAAGLGADLEGWLTRDERPRWLTPRAPDPERARHDWRMRPLALEFDGWLASAQCSITASPRAGDDWGVDWPLTVLRDDIAHLHEYRVVARVVNSAGAGVWGTEWPLEPFLSGRAQRLEGTGALPAGDYALEVEIRNDRTRKRLRVTRADPAIVITRGKRARLADIAVAAGATGD